MIMIHDSTGCYEYTFLFYLHAVFLDNPTVLYTRLCKAVCTVYMWRAIPGHFTEPRVPVYKSRALKPGFTGFVACKIYLHIQ